VAVKFCIPSLAPTVAADASSFSGSQTEVTVLSGRMAANSHGTLILANCSEDALRGIGMLILPCSKRFIGGNSDFLFGTGWFTIGFVDSCNLLFEM
jgi:hypothetical protein